MENPKVAKPAMIWPIRFLLRGWGEDEHRSALMLWQLSRRYWKPALLAITFSTAAGFFAFGTAPVLVLAVQSLFGDADASFADAIGSIGSIADTLFGDLSRETIGFILIGITVAAEILRSAMVFASHVASAYFQADVFKDVWGRIFNHLLEMNFARSSRYQAGDLNQYVWDANTMYAAFQQISVLIGNFAVTVGYMAAMLWISWPMTLVSLGLVGVLIVLILPILQRVRLAAEAHLPARVEMGNRSLEFLSGLRLLHTFSQQDFAKQQMEASVAEAMKQTRRCTIWQQSIQPLMYSITVVAAASFLIGGYSISNAQEIPKLIAFIFILSRLLPQVGNFNASRASLVGTFPVMRRVTDMLRTDDKDFVSSGDVPFNALKQSIEFKNVSLRYLEEEGPAVHQISFTLPRGSMVALVGESGGGKSTLADLLLRLYDPDSGEVIVDGIPLKQYVIADWRNKIGVVGQDTVLFHASIRENIAFGKLDAITTEIEDAAQKAHADGFIKQLAQGYETIVGDRGYRLSGGQRQRIAIARAIVRQPEILVLDEATSNLDSSSERMIQQALDGLRSNRTVLVIAHRLSTIAMADQILVVEKGRVIEQGTHKELLETEGRYAGMWKLQTAIEQAGSVPQLTPGDAASATE